MKNERRDKMNGKKLLGWILKAPMILLILGSFIGGVYAAYKNIQGITYATPAIIGAIIAAYLIGAWLINSEDEEDDD